MFEHSRVPAALADRDRRFVAVNDAAVQLHGVPRDEVIGSVSGSRIVDEDPTLGTRLWERLVRTNELYVEHLMTHRNGAPLRVAFAAHGTMITGRWLALIVTLSAHYTSDGVELIRLSDDDPDWHAGRASNLTPRERDIVRRVALGAGTRRIAADLYLSPSTVRTHVRSAMVKAHAHTRAQLVAIILAEDGIGEQRVYRRRT
ncbi:MAG TPA: LuxR C-terminal-related transcriptional regulator [Solirubrobacteraceae bacterium]|nr:LuxR C-terminal-related transcriptional regulator [Solirubrobacteraceae bacterium]